MSPAWVARPLPAATMVAVAPTLVARSQVSFSVRAMLARVAMRSWEFPCGGVPERPAGWLSVLSGGPTPISSQIGPTMNKPPRGVQKGVRGGCGGGMFGSGSSVIAKVLWALGAQAGNGSAAAGPDAGPTTATTVLLESSALAMVLLNTFMSANFRQPIPRAYRAKCLYLPQGGHSHRHHLTHRSISIHFSGVAAAYGTAL